MLLVCDDCKKEFTMDIKEKRIENSITKTYFTCPHCCKEYVSYYSDEKIRRKQQEIQDIIKKQRYNRGKTNIDYSIKLNKQYKKLKKQLKKDMELLKIKIRETN